MTAEINASVIIPVYNGQDEIKSLIESLLSETECEFEIIVINDGSTDDTAEVLSGINDPRLKIINQSNKGVYAARNAALEVQQGKWVMFLDADDSITPGFIANRINVAEKAGVDVVISNAIRLDKNNDKSKLVHEKQIYNTVISGSAWINHAVECKEWPHYLWLQTVSAEFIKKSNLRFQLGRSHKDILWTAELATRGADFLITPEADYNYRYNAASITNRKDYYDFRASSYIDVISSFITLANDPSNKKIKSALIRHSLIECRHFFGLYKRKVQDKDGIKKRFREKVSLRTVFKGIRSWRDFFFFFKLSRQVFF